MKRWYQMMGTTRTRAARVGTVASAVFMSVALILGAAPQPAAAAVFR
jgi:hypothetical protein